MFQYFRNHARRKEEGGMKKRKKSFIGWAVNDWSMETIEHSSVQEIYHIDHNMIFKTKSDCCDLLMLPDGEYKPKKVRITIEEI